MINITQSKKIFQTTIFILGLSATAAWSMEAVNVPILDKEKVSKPKKIPCKLSIKKYTKEQFFTFGSTGTYMIDVTNAGKKDCHKIRVKDRLPKGMQYTGGNTPGWNCNGNNSNPQTVTCEPTASPLLSGQSLPTIRLEVYVPKALDAIGYGWDKNEVKNCASVRSRNWGIIKPLKKPYPYLGFSCTTTPVKITKPKPCKLSITKTTQESSFSMGGTGTYDLDVSNIGKGTCHKIGVRDTLPEGMLYTGGNTPGWDCSGNNSNPQTVTCLPTALPLLSGQSLPTIHLEIELPNASDAGGDGWDENNSEVTNCGRVKGVGVNNSSDHKSCIDTPVDAPTQTLTFCLSDTMLILDKSSSMRHFNRMVNAKTASNNFATIALNYMGNQVGVGSFNDLATLDLSLNTNLTTVQTAINALNTGGSTNINSGFIVGFNELISNSLLSKRILVLLSDGRHNSDGISNVPAGSLDTAAHINTAIANDITVYTIGYGISADAALQPIATGSGGLYFNPPTDADLTHIYRDIAEDACQASISGMKFEDLNGNGIKDANEVHLGGVTINLYSTDSTGTSVLIDSSVTSSVDGTYRFSNLTPSNYTISEVVPSGWTQTSPTANGGTYPVTIVAGQKIKNQNFGNQRSIVTTSISGMKFNDLNGNSVEDTNEPPLEGVIIRLYETSTMTLVDTTTTDIDGIYQFSSLDAGSYIVREVVGSLGAGWTQTYPATNAGIYEVDLTVGQNIENLNFGNTEDICDANIHGKIYDDKNNNGIFDGTDVGLAGWYVLLSTGDFVQSDSNGDYSIPISSNIINNSGGTLLVNIEEWIHSFWEHTEPSTGEYTSIPVSLNDDLEYNFGNYKTCGGKSQSRCRQIYSDINVYTEDKNIILENTGSIPVKRMGMIVKNHTNTDLYEDLKNWKCSGNSAMKQVSCRYKGELKVGEKLQLSLPYDKMVGTTLTVFTDNESNIKNNILKFSKEGKRK